MKFSKDELILKIKKIRKEIGHSDSEINIKKLIFNNNNDELWIIAPDRPDKSAIIGKGGWVVGKLKEDLNVNSIHVESYSDFIIKKYRMELSFNALNSFISNYNGDKSPLINLKVILEKKIDDLYNFDFSSYLNNVKKEEYDENNDHKAIVALSGGVDSSFSLILAKYLGFNPIAITINPGTIVLPKQFKNNINKLCDVLNIQHEFLAIDFNNIINNALNGKFHPCGRCSNLIENRLYKYALNNNINIVIFGDMLSTGSQCITKSKITFNNNKFLNNTTIYRLNLPATLSVTKEEIKNLTNKYDLDIISGFGCPLLYEVHKKYPHMKKFSIQRILRETRSNALEPGEALDLIWSFYKTN